MLVESKSILFFQLIRLIPIFSLCFSNSNCSSVYALSNSYSHIDSFQKKGGGSLLEYNEASNYNKRRLGIKRVTSLPESQENSKNGISLTPWLRITARTHHKKKQWALGYTVLHAYWSQALKNSTSFKLTGDVIGGAGAGIGGGVCIQAGDCSNNSDGPHWYEGLAYGTFIELGGGLSYQKVTAFSRARLRATQAWSLPTAFRFQFSTGFQVVLPENFRFFISATYMQEWNFAATLKSPGFEIGLEIPIGLF